LSDAGESLPGQGEFSLTTFDLKIAAGARGCLIDTSIWVEALRSRDRHIAHPVTPVIQEISEADFIYTSRLIVAEIMAGARTRREAEKLEDDFQGFRFCDEDLTLFRDAAFIRQAYMRAFGKRSIPGLIDCYLVHLAKKENLIVFTADRPLRSVAEFRGVKGIFFAIQSKELSYIT